jgi:hypothetical protein
MEHSNKIQRSEVWEQIYNVISKIPRKEVDGDAADAPSVATELEELFLKLFETHAGGKILSYLSQTEKYMISLAKEVNQDFAIELSDLINMRRSMLNDNIIDHSGLELRMYFFTIYQLSGIQAGIQCGHAALEYANMYKDDPQYKDFIENWKTWVILNGGTTNSCSDELGSLNEIVNQFGAKGIKYSVFHEPDLNNALTAMCFIADSRVFTFKPSRRLFEYTDHETLRKEGIEYMGSE